MANLNQTIHGHAKNGVTTPEYRCWQDMKTRCFNPHSLAFQHYGGRGITVCDRWRYDFAAFLADIGSRPTADHSLDRYPNNDGNYEPGNVRWALPAQQSQNRRPDLVRGTSRPLAKLDDAKVRAIRADTRSQHEIAAAFDIAQSIVSEIKNRKAWAHVAD